MAMFDALHTSASALTVNRTWMDAISDNLANMNTVRPMDQAAFQERFVVAQSVEGDGVGADGGIGRGARVAGVQYGSAAGRVVHDPTHPFANAEGYVRYPDVDMGNQMVQMMLAQRGYQANLAAIERARNSYEAALELGK